MLVSVMEGSLVYEDRIRSVWALNDGDMFHVDFLEKNVRI